MRAIVIFLICMVFLILHLKMTSERSKRRAFLSSVFMAKLISKKLLIELKTPLLFISSPVGFKTLISMVPEQYSYQLRA